MPTAAEFFSEAFRGCGGWLEIRLIPSRQSRFFPLPTGIEQAVRFATEQSGREHVFFGVYPRSREGGRDASAVRQVQLLYCDLDADHFANGVGEIDARLAAFAPPPSAVVASGGGRHAYWLLSRPLDALPGDGHRQVQDCLWGIADALGVPRAKNAVHDLARVLRVPGTLNVKPEYGPKGALCEVLAWEPSRRYPPSAFREFALRGRSRPKRADGESSAADPDREPDPEAVLARLQPSPAILELIRNGAPPGQRSEADQKVIVHLLARGATREEILAVFRNPAWGIGSKFREKGRDGIRYLLHSIANAESWLRQREQEIADSDFAWATTALDDLPEELRAALLRPPSDPEQAAKELALVVREWAVEWGIRPAAIRLALAYYVGHLPLRVLRSAIERGLPKDATEPRANAG